MIHLNTTPVQHVSDDQQAKAFHMDLLGFDTVNEAGGPVTGFGISLAHGARVFPHRWEGQDAAWQGRCGFFCCPDPNGMIAKLIDLKQTVKGPSNIFCNWRKTKVTGPDATVLCFGQDA